MAFVARAPLFDQLTDQSEFLTGGKLDDIGILLTKEELLKSIRRELEDIFNTRSSLTSEEMDQLIESTADESLLAGIEGFMGLPSMPNIFVEGGSDWGSFQDKCALMIRLYEPRLQNPSVTATTFDTGNLGLNLIISSTLSIHEIRENVSFTLAIHPSSES